MTLPETQFSGGYLCEIPPRNFMISTCETGKRKRAPPDIGHASLVFPPNKVPPPENQRMGPVEKGTGIPKRSESSSTNFEVQPIFVETVFAACAA